MMRRIFCLFVLLALVPNFAAAKSKPEKTDVLEIVYLPEKLSAKAIQVATTQDYKVHRYRRTKQQIYIKMKPIDSSDPHEFVEWYLSPLDDSNPEKLSTPEGERPYMVMKKIWKLKKVAHRSKPSKGKK
jgi:hypothetical protein